MACSEELPLTPLVSSQEPLHSLISQPAGLVQSSTALLHFPSRQYCLSFFTSLRHDREKKKYILYKRSASLKDEEMKRKRCQLQGTMGDAPFMDIFNSDILYADAPHILSIELCLLKRHQGAKVLKHELMKQNSSLWPQRSGNKMLTILWSPESSQAVDYTIVSGWSPYYSRDTGPLRGNISSCTLSVLCYLTYSTKQHAANCPVLISADFLVAR